MRDVYATQTELEQRGVTDRPRRAGQEPWGLHEMHVTDPDGVTLIFVQVPDTHPLRRDSRRLNVPPTPESRGDVGCNVFQLAGSASGQPTEANREATWWISSGFGSLSMTLWTAVWISASVTVSECSTSGSTARP